MKLVLPITLKLYLLTINSNTSIVKKYVLEKFD